MVSRGFTARSFLAFLVSVTSGILTQPSSLWVWLHMAFSACTFVSGSLSSLKNTSLTGAGPTPVILS